MQTTTVLVSATRGATFARLIANAIGWLARRQQVRRDIALLSTLDDKQLADIGFNRDQLGLAAWHGRLPVRHFS